MCSGDQLFAGLHHPPPPRRLLPLPLGHALTTSCSSSYCHLSDLQPEGGSLLLSVRTEHTIYTKLLSLSSTEHVRHIRCQTDFSPTTSAPEKTDPGWVTAVFIPSIHSCCKPRPLYLFHTFSNIHTLPIVHRSSSKVLLLIMIYSLSCL